MPPKKTQQRTAIAYCLHDDTDYLQVSLDSVALLSYDNVPEPRDLQDVFAFISRFPWHGAPGDWQAAATTAEALGLTVIPGDWPNEHAQRQAIFTPPLSQPLRQKSAPNYRAVTAG